MAWKEDIVEDIKTTHTTAEIWQYPQVRELRKLVLKTCLKYCQKGRLESNRGLNCPVVLQYFY